MFGWVRRRPVLGGFVLMFACTWPVDLWAAAASHGWAVPPVPPVLPILVGYGFVVAALVATVLISIGLHAVAAVAVVVATGPARLSRSARAEVNLKTA